MKGSNEAIHNNLLYPLTIPNESSSNCYDCLCYSLLQYYHFDYKAYNIKYFYTEYISQKSNRIFRGIPSVNFIKLFFGIEATYCQKKNSSPLLEVVEDRISVGPVGITIDPYNCWWSPFYQKQHYSHMLAIVGVDYIKQKYTCFDAYYPSSGYVEVDFDMLEENYLLYFMFNMPEPQPVPMQSLLSHLSNMLENFDSNLTQKKEQMLRIFTENSRQTLFPGAIDSSILLVNLMWIAEDKKHFAIALRYLEERLHKNVFDAVYEPLRISEQAFTLLRFSLMKYAMTGVLRDADLKKRINQIYDTDAIIVEKLRESLKQIGSL